MIETRNHNEVNQLSWQTQSLLVVQGKEERLLPKLWSAHIPGSAAARLPSEIISDLKLVSGDKELPELAGLELNGTLFIWTSKQGVFPSHNEVNRALANELTKSRIKFSVHYEFNHDIQSLELNVFIFFPPGMSKQSIESWYIPFLQPVVDQFTQTKTKLPKTILFKVLESSDVTK